MRHMFTAEELEELRRADAQIDAEFVMTPEDMQFSRRMDRAVALDRKDNRDRKIAERSAAYRAANKDKYRAYMRDYMRDYMRKRRAAKKAPPRVCKTQKRQRKI